MSTDFDSLEFNREVLEDFSEGRNEEWEEIYLDENFLTYQWNSEGLERAIHLMEKNGRARIAAEAIKEYPSGRIGKKQQFLYNVRMDLLEESLGAAYSKAESYSEEELSINQASSPT